MKKTALFFILFTTVIAMAQENAKPKNYVDFDFGIKVFAFVPIQFGDHSLAKAHNSTVGFGLNAKILSYGNFHFNTGLDFASYPVSDEAIVGSFKRSSYSSIYGTFSYEWPITKEIHLLPDAGFGYAVINQRSGIVGFGHQDGVEMRGGLYGNYYFNRTFSVFVGVHYIHNRFEIKTNPDYKKFFGQADQVQLAVGIQFD